MEQKVEQSIETLETNLGLQEQRGQELLREHERISKTLNEANQRSKDFESKLNKLQHGGFSAILDSLPHSIVRDLPLRPFASQKTKPSKKLVWTLEAVSLTSEAAFTRPKSRSKPRKRPSRTLRARLTASRTRKVGFVQFASLATGLLTRFFSPVIWLQDKAALEGKVGQAALESKEQVSKNPRVGRVSFSDLFPFYAGKRISSLVSNKRLRS